MQLGSRLITNVETRESVAALTFDDGPDPVYTPRILRVLKKYGARATFFMVGEAAARFPEILKEVVRDGHVIGNHSWNHPYLPHVRSRFDRLKQIWKCARATAPHCQRLFRPPFGAQNDQIRLDTRLFRYQVILWSASAQDWTPQNSQEISQKIIDRVKPGSIFLLHDAIFVDRDMPDAVKDRNSMVQGLETALSVIQERIRFVTVPELLTYGRPVCHWPIPDSQ